MPLRAHSLLAFSTSCVMALSATALWSAGCGSGGGLSALFGPPLIGVINVGDGDGDGDAGGDDDDDGFFDDDGRGEIDPCEETLSRKFVTISIQNLAPNDHVHYFLVFIATVNGETYPDGAVCADDIALYTEFGYRLIGEGSAEVFGDYCLIGPMLVYFHENGRFRSAGGGFASAIPPAQGSNPTFDTFFTSSGARVPVPEFILFHNPGTGDGASLQVSQTRTNPCNPEDFGGSGTCAQDSFYYVDETDRLAGSTSLGNGSGRRVPTDIQGSGCECSGFTDATQQLAPSGTSASNALCSEFTRGGRIEYIFIREDADPPFPQLLWRVTDAGGAVVHDFDSRASLP